MALTFTIAGVDRTSYVLVDSLSVSDVLNGRNQATFTVHDELGVYRPAEGDTVAVTRDGGTDVFAGTIFETAAEADTERGFGVVVDVVCVDHNELADRHHVARAYEVPGQTLADIVIDIVTNDLAGEGITTAGVETGPVIEKAVWNYATATVAFNELADLAGMAWWIDYDKVLHFRARDSIAAPFDLTASSGNYRKMRVQRTRERYRNRQFIRAGVDLTDARAEEFRGDNSTRAWPLQYPVGAVPSAISVNGVPATIGIGGVESGKDFYWNKGDPLIKQADGATLLTDTDEASITYQGQVPILVVAQIDAEVTARIAAEGGTGIYEAIEDFPNVDIAAQAQQIGAGLLAQLGRIPAIVTYETDVDGLAAGQIQSITNALLGLSGSFLISEVTAGDFTGRGELRYQVKALDGSQIGGWVDFFRALAQAGRQYVIRENEVVVQFRSMPEAVLAGESLVVTSPFSIESRVGYALVNLSEVS